MLNFQILWRSNFLNIMQSSNKRWSLTSLFANSCHWSYWTAPSRLCSHWCAELALTAAARPVWFRYVESLPASVGNLCAVWSSRMRIRTWTWDACKPRKRKQPQSQTWSHETRHSGLLRVRSGASGSRPAGVADGLRGEPMQHDLYVWVPGVSGEYPG